MNKSLCPKLLEYETQFAAWLNTSRSLSVFKQRVSAELYKLGISDWSYSRLDIPKYESIVKQVGNDFTVQNEEYIREAFYECDFLLEHVFSSPSPMFQSTIERYISSSPFETERIERNFNLFNMKRKYGYNNFLCLPYYSESYTSKVMLTVAAKSMSVDDFFHLALKHMDKLNIITKVIDKVGTRSFADAFLGAKMEYEKLVENKSILLLEAMAKEDLTLSQAASKVHLSLSTAEKRMTMVRNKLGTRTTSGAVRQAILRGYINPNSN